MAKNLEKKPTQKAKKITTTGILSAHGLSNFKRPDIKGVDDIPDDPTVWDSKKLSKMQTRMVNMQAYANVRLAYVSSRLLMVTNSLRVAKAKFRVTRGSAKNTKWKLDDEMITDPSILALQSKELRLTAEKNLLEAVAKGYENKAKVLSREQTRRESEFNLAGRS